MTAKSLGYFPFARRWWSAWGFFLFVCKYTWIHWSLHREGLESLHFSSPHNCTGQGILKDLVSLGTQLTKLQGLFQKWLTQTLPISGIPYPTPQIPCPIAGPVPGTNYRQFSRQQHIQPGWRSRSSSLESHPTSREVYGVFSRDKNEVLSITMKP